MEKIKEILKSEPAFRLKQVERAIFFDLIENWQNATTLPKDLRLKMSEAYPLPELALEQLLVSKDKETLKALFELFDGQKIEAVLMRHGDGRNTVCISCQAGCALGCSFCATGRQGFKRNLTEIEILGQVLFFARHLKKTKEKISNIVFMGMGEPFLNYDNVMAAVRILNDKNCFNLGARHISISTCGITEGIDKLAQEPLQVNLAISLHAPNDELRTKLMPINKSYPIEKIFAAVENYVKKTNRRVMFEYLMIDGINDGTKEAGELAEVLHHHLFFVNLISFNPTGHAEFRPSSAMKIKKFKEVLQKAGIEVTQRYRFGKEINAACGQLAGL